MGTTSLSRALIGSSRARLHENARGEGQKRQIRRVLRPAAAWVEMKAGEPSVAECSGMQSVEGI
ncbi:hypothetical protein SAMN05444161_0005 [Rhizobiales bacterium GAS191]|nr:hypothetical protein SAMN05444161_0005 [Rhizobiales bacterium GAS191]